jgi:hypothetical protein
VGLAGRLFGAILAGYNSAVQSFGHDYEEIRSQFNAERLYLEKWAEAWIDGRGCLKMDLSNPHYWLIVTTLVRMLAVFTELSESHSKHVVDRHHRESKGLAFRKIFSRLLPSSARPEIPPSSPSFGIDRASIELLKNPGLISVRPELENELIHLRNSAEGLQKMLSSGVGLHWSAVDNTRLKGLLNQLKTYNQDLKFIPPIESIIQSYNPAGITGRSYLTYSGSSNNCSINVFNGPVIRIAPHSSIQSIQNGLFTTFNAGSSVFES